jgi:alpha-beta hydrolase superfamily lysophospholipase
MSGNNTNFSVLIFVIVLLLLQGCSGAPLKPWHTERLDEEFTQDKVEQVKNFDGYLQLEDRLFKQLDEKVYAQTETGPAFQLARYSSGSAADPRKRLPNWNRSFELIAEQPRGAVLLLHGMSDSPYALRALGRTLNKKGYWVIGLRMPGHGTAPSGLRFINRFDMAAAVRLGMAHLKKKVNGKPVHMIGYSTGAPLAVEFALDALEGKSTPVPDSLTLISPAIGVHSVAAFASFTDGLSILPGLSRLAFLDLYAEFDPYKYNSFATNAGSVVHNLTRAVSERIRQRVSSHSEIVLPPTIIFKSTVDATVTTNAVVDRLLKLLKPHRHELVLFDINRYAVVKSRMLINDPAPFTNRVMDDDTLPFDVTLVTNENSNTTRVISQHKPPFSAAVTDIKPLGLSWTPGVISLSHIALPISTSDPLYGLRGPDNDDFLFLGQLAIQGERGLLQIPIDWMIRLRYNPFYDYLEKRTLDWLDKNINTH